MAVGTAGRHFSKHIFNNYSFLNGQNPWQLTQHRAEAHKKN